MTEVETPLVELLESVPKDARMIYEHNEFHSQNIPVGVLCHRAANALRDRLAQPDREWVGLTDEEENDIYIKNLTTAKNFVRAAEAKLKEKNS